MANKNVNAAISLRSEAVQEIIGHRPLWIVRWGMGIFLIVLLLFLSLGWFIRYPDLVKGTFRLTTSSVPKPLTAKTDGKLVRLLVSDDQRVRKNQVLGYMESTADPKEVLALSAMADSLAALYSQENYNGLKKIYSHRFAHLGELQSAFLSFDQSFVQFSYYLNGGFYLTKKAMLNGDLANLTAQEENLKTQKLIYIHDLALSTQEFNAKKKLADKGVIAPLEFKQEESRLLGKQLPVQQLNASILTNGASQNDKRKELMELERQIREQGNTFEQALSLLKSAVEAWKVRYLLIAPIDGKVIFPTLLQEKQVFTSGQEMFFISPLNSGYAGEMLVAQQNFGKVTLGEKVVIRLAGYPFQEYGLLIGTIDFISQIPDKDKNYLIRVRLPQGLTTNYHKQIPFKNGMTADADIVTKKTRLLVKFLYQLRKNFRTAG